MTTCAHASSWERILAALSVTATSCQAALPRTLLNLQAAVGPWLLLLLVDAARYFHQ
jgi:hypothetical protein